MDHGVSSGPLADCEVLGCEVGEFVFGRGVVLDEVVVAVDLVPLHLVADCELGILCKGLKQGQVVPCPLFLGLLGCGSHALAEAVFEVPFGKAEHLQEETQVDDLGHFGFADPRHHIDFFEGNDVADSFVEVLLLLVLEDELHAGTAQAFLALPLQAQEAEVGGGVGFTALVLLSFLLQLLLEVLEVALEGLGELVLLVLLKLVLDVLALEFFLDHALVAVLVGFAVVPLLSQELLVVAFLQRDVLLFLLVHAVEFCNALLELVRRHILVLEGLCGVLLG